MTSERLHVQLKQKRIGANIILRDIDFHVAAGEIVAILGASGCGKSTLLRAIGNLDRDFDGRIARHAATAGASAKVSMVYQEARLMPWLSVTENVGFALDAESTKCPNPSNGAAIEAVLGEVGLTDAAMLYPKSLSGGMAQRVSIARALVREPDILLMDEPFSALDVLTRRRLYALTRDVTARHRTATVIVTHDPDEAVTLADRVLVLGRDGELAGATIRTSLVPSTDLAYRAAQVEDIIAALDAWSQPTNTSLETATL